MELSESQTRALLINPLLVNAEWKLSDRTQVGFEIPVDGYDPKPWNGITDYCLYSPKIQNEVDSTSGGKIMQTARVLASPPNA